MNHIQHFPGRLFYSFLVTLLLVACSEAPEPQLAVPESVINLAPLVALHKQFEAGKHGNIDGVMVLHGNEVVFEKRYVQDYRTPFEEYVAAGIEDNFAGPEPYHYLDPDWHPWLKGSDLHTMQSVTKSVASALIGVAIGRGEIAGVDVEVDQYFDHPNPFQGDPRATGMTLEDLLTMSAGIDWDEENYSADGNDCIIMEHSQDWVDYVLNKGMAVERSEVFNYNSGISVLLDQVLWKATGLHADRYAEEYFFGPLGIDEYYWKTTPTGIVDTEGGLYLTPRSLARIGELYAADGVWNGQRIFPEGWVESSFAPSIPVGEDSPWLYGYQWWLLPDPDDPERLIPAARGFGGQYLLIFSEDDVIAVFNGWNIHPGKTPLSIELAIEHVLNAVRKDRSS